LADCRFRATTHGRFKRTGGHIGPPLQIISILALALISLSCSLVIPAQAGIQFLFFQSTISNWQSATYLSPSPLSSPRRVEETHCQFTIFYFILTPTLSIISLLASRSSVIPASE